MTPLRLLALLVTVSLASLLTSCVSINSVNSDYQTALEDTTPQKFAPKRTVIFFLIDGLPLSTLQEMTKQHRLPQIEKFFLPEGQAIYQGATVFPSLTYPSITTFLTGLPVDQHRVIGNKMRFGGEDIDFESPLERQPLTNLIEDKTVFTKLRRRGQTSVSFDYPFTAGATASLPGADLQTGLNVISQNYEEVDDKIITSLYTLLNETPVANWPNFIFVHVIGVDMTSHDFGPRAPEVRGYLEQIDTKLKNVFKILRKNEGKRSLITLLSSDHGFDHKISKVIDIEAKLSEIDDNIEVVNEGRFVSLYFPTTWTKERRKAFLKKLAANSDIAVTASRDKSDVSVYTSSAQLTLTLREKTLKDCQRSDFLLKVAVKNQDAVKGFEDFLCPEKFEEAQAPVYLYPRFVSNFAHYFHAPNHPDGVIIPLSGVAFSDDYEGQHGGLTPEEVSIPILMRNAKPTNSGRIIPSRELLDFLCDS